MRRYVLRMNIEVAGKDVFAIRLWGWVHSLRLWVPVGFPSVLPERNL